ncbi:MAG: 5-formyltetrahydrofolate cyclo-ligase [Akkermansia sp.]
MELNVEKNQLRQAVLNRLKSSCIGAVRKEQSLLLRRQLAAQLGGSTATTMRMAIYASLEHEVDMIPLLRELPQHQYYFPRCYAKGEMNFHQVQAPDSEMERSKKGFWEPHLTCPTIAAAELDVIIVPGVAFTREGARLGYGGGYYDRYLPQCPQARCIALCFPEQLVDGIPTEAHDLRIPQIISL